MIMYIKAQGESELEEQQNSWRSNRQQRMLQ